MSGGMLVVVENWSKEDGYKIRNTQGHFPIKDWRKAERLKAELKRDFPDSNFVIEYEEED